MGLVLVGNGLIFLDAPPAPTGPQLTGHALEMQQAADAAAAEGVFLGNHSQLEQDVNRR